MDTFISDRKVPKHKPYFTSSSKKIKVDGYGTVGQKTGNTIAAAIDAYRKNHPDSKLSVSFDKKSKKFIIANSSGFKSDDLRVLLAKYKFSDWYPVVDSMRDKQGNLTISLSGINPNQPDELGKRLVNGKETQEPMPIANDTITGKEVPQGRAIISGITNNIKNLQTFGLGPCIAVTIYHEGQKIGALAHLDTPSKAKGLQSIIERMSQKGINPSELEARIIGGDGTNVSNETFETVKNILYSRNIDIVETNIGSHYNRPTGINLNLKTGEVSAYTETIPWKNDKSYLELVKSLSMMSLFSPSLTIIDDNPDI